MSTVMMNVDSEKLERVMDSFRRWGYLQANLDPLEHFNPLPHPELDVPAKKPKPRAAFIPAASAWSSCTSPIPKAASGSRNGWKAEQGQPVDRARVLDQLVRADVFEQTIHSRYIGTKRYSLEGNTALIPLLDEILDTAAEEGAEQAVLAMSHRGRLNVIINVVNRPAAEIFAGFEDVDPRSVLGGGDVKYHIGATGNLHRGQRRAGAHSPGLESQPSRSGESGGHGPRPRQADAHRARRQAEDRAHHHARRRRFCGAGNHRREPEPGQPARLHRRRNSSHHR